MPFAPSLWRALTSSASEPLLELVELAGGGFELLVYVAHDGFVLYELEGVGLAIITGHGGIFKTERVGQSFLAAALGVPVTVMKTAGEGGAWGMAILANYMIRKDKDESLEAYLQDKVFRGQEGVTLAPDPADVKGFEEFAARYVKALPVVREAVKCME